MRYPSVEHRSVIVTGCSSGIGETTARHLREAGWTVLPTARKPEDLESLRAEGFTPIELDLMDSDSVGRAAETALEILDGTVGGIVNNAGFVQPGAVEDVGREAMRRQFEVNVFGMQELTNRFVPVFRKQGWGRIVNVSSIFGIVSAPIVGTYCASKFAMEALSDALRVELRDAGVAVSLIEPGAIITKLRQNAAGEAEASLPTEGSAFADLYERRLRRKKKEKKPSLVNRPPEEVARKILHALESPRPGRRYRITLPARLAGRLLPLLPTALVDRLLARRVRR